MTLRSVPIGISETVVGRRRKDKKKKKKFEVFKYISWSVVQNAAVELLVVSEGLRTQSLSLPRRSHQISPSLNQWCDKTHSSLSDRFVHPVFCSVVLRRAHPNTQIPWQMCEAKSKTQRCIKLINTCIKSINIMHGVSSYSLGFSSMW